MKTRSPSLVRRLPQNPRRFRRPLPLNSCTLHLTHDDGTCSALPLHPAEASADEGRFLRLLREHLGRLQLAAPVAAITSARSSLNVS